MKKVVKLICVAALMVCLLCACGNIEGFIEGLGEDVIAMAEDFMAEKEAQDALEQNNTPGTVTDPGSTVQQSVQHIVSESEDAPRDDVVMVKDYGGIAQVHTFSFTNGYLTAGKVTMQCADSNQQYSAREFFLDANENGDLFVNISTVQATVSADYTSAGLEPFVGYTADELVTFLQENYLT